MRFSRKRKPVVKSSARGDIRLIAGVHGSHGRVELRDGDEWRDISRFVTGATAHVEAGDRTKIDLRLAFVTADVEGLASAETVEMFERFVGLARFRWTFPRAPRFAA